MKLVELPVPEPSEDEVLIEVAYAGVIFADVLLRGGNYKGQAKWTFPAVPGTEVVGTVTAVGANVDNVRVGARVSAELIAGGGYAEYAVADRRRITELPEEASFESALVYSFNLPAAYILQHKYVPLRPQSTVLVHSGAGGLGSMLIRVAKHDGHRVIALVSSEDKISVASGYGADAVVLSRNDQYVDDVMEITEGRGVNAIFNHRVGRTLVSDLKVIARQGLWFFVNTLDGFEGVDFWAIRRDLFRLGPIIIPAGSETFYGSGDHREAMTFLSEYLKKADLETPTRTYPLERASEAHQWLESGRSVGKLAIKI